MVVKQNQDKKILLRIIVTGRKRDLGIELGSTLSIKWTVGTYSEVAEWR